MNRKLTIIGFILWFILAVCSFGAFPVHTSTGTFAIATASSASWTAFTWHWSDQDNQQISVTFNGATGGTNIMFRLAKPMTGPYWLQVNNCTMLDDGTNTAYTLPVAISPSNLPPTDEYFAEFILINTGNTQRTIARGTVETEWSLFSITNSTSWTPVSISYVTTGGVSLTETDPIYMASDVRTNYVPLTSDPATNYLKRTGDTSPGGFTNVFTYSSSGVSIGSVACGHYNPLGWLGYAAAGYSSNVYLVPHQQSANTKATLYYITTEHLSLGDVSVDEEVFIGRNGLVLTNLNGANVTGNVTTNSLTNAIKQLSIAAFPLTANGNMAGFSLTNGSFAGNGPGLTNLVIPRYVDKGDGTVEDTATGLIWDKNASHGQMSVDSAITYIAALNTNGYKGFYDWRLPSVYRTNVLTGVMGLPELDTLGRAGGISTNPWTAPGLPFTNTQWANYGYWSSTFKESGASGKAYLLTIAGDIGEFDHTYPAYRVWPVRGGRFIDSEFGLLRTNINMNGHKILSQTTNGVITISLDNNGLTIGTNTFNVDSSGNITASNVYANLGWVMGSTFRALATIQSPTNIAAGSTEITLFTNATFSTGAGWKLGGSIAWDSGSLSLLSGLTGTITPSGAVTAAQGSYCHVSYILPQASTGTVTWAGYGLTNTFSFARTAGSLVSNEIWFVAAGNSSTPTVTVVSTLGPLTLDNLNCGIVNQGAVIGRYGYFGDSAVSPLGNFLVVTGGTVYGNCGLTNAQSSLFSPSNAASSVNRVLQFNTNSSRWYYGPLVAVSTNTQFSDLLGSPYANTNLSNALLVAGPWIADRNAGFTASNHIWLAETSTAYTASELVTNGQFSTKSGWSWDNNSDPFYWTIFTNNGSAVFSNDYQHSAFRYSPIAFVPGGVYTCSFSVSQIDTTKLNNASFNIIGGTDIIYRSFANTGTFSFVFTNFDQASPTGIVISFNAIAGAPYTATLTNVSVRGSVASAGVATNPVLTTGSALNYNNITNPPSVSSLTPTNSGVAGTIYDFKTTDNGAHVYLGEDTATGGGITGAVVGTYLFRTNFDLGYDTNYFQLGATNGQDKAFLGLNPTWVGGLAGGADLSGLSNAIPNLSGLSNAIPNLSGLSNAIPNLSSLSNGLATKVTATNAFSPTFINQDGGGTVLISRANGNYFSCARTNPITIDFVTNGWAASDRMTVALDMLAGTGAVTFLSSSVWNTGTYSSTNLGTLSTTATVPLMFDKASGNLFPSRVYNLAK